MNKFRLIIAATLLFTVFDAGAAPKQEMAKLEPQSAQALKSTKPAKTPKNARPARFGRGNHIVALMNLSPEWTCIGISLNNTSWSPTPYVGRTCEYNQSEIDRCFREGKYKEIGVVDCGRPTQVWLKFQNAQGQQGVLKDPYQWTPDCSKRGTVIVFVP